MYRCIPLLMAACALALTSGCGGSKEVEQRPEQMTQTPPSLEFQTTTDTVHAERAEPRTPSASDQLLPEIRYMVQIGAFKDPQNASRIQSLARARYRIPVLNDFHPVYGLYQIRIGFFETVDAAREFRDRLKHEFPNDYADSWVVQLKRQP